MIHIKTSKMITKNKRLVGILVTIAGLLSLPLIAMQFTSEVDWNAFDFIIMGILLLAAGLGCELVLRKVKKASHRLAICFSILFIFLLIWAELAVGIFGTPFAGS
jgi:cytochrome bd-type quinol oxidase subunit 2